ncbi:MAG: threonylcarbamoyl-AMP synthase [Ignavibacteriae bacterium]|nr:MAG: threonylcarbamoyl-AMP synthase [Ignavibacteriota bacterium]
MPRTRIIQCADGIPNPDGITDAVGVLNAGGLVAFPTETVYGLGADAFNQAAVRKIFEAKGRPSDNPLIVHVASLEIAWHFISDISEKGLTLASRFWPGPLTLVVKRKEIVPSLVTAGLETVAIRIPNHAVTLELLARFGGGLVGPSANSSGRPSPTSADHVVQDLNGKIDLILDSGPTIIGLESTVIDVTTNPPVILRLGGLSREDIEKEIGETHRTRSKDLLKRSPGTRYRHYAPRAQVVIVPHQDRDAFVKQLEHLKDEGKRVGAITSSEDLNAVDRSPSHLILSSSVDRYAQQIFHALRELDRSQVDCILVEGVEETGIGAAIMDRLMKASENKSRHNG